MIKAVIFDMDGILIDTEKYLYRYWKQAAQEAGYELTHEQLLRFRSFAKEYAEPYFKELLGQDFDYAAVRARRMELMRGHLAEHGVEKKPGVDEFLEWLTVNGYKKAVSTAADAERTKEYLTQIGIYDRFDRIACAPSLPHGKPMPDVYLYVCAQIGERPEECLALEDSDNGALAAHRAGCRVVMVKDLAEPLPETARFLTGTAENLLEVIPILEHLQKDSKAVNAEKIRIVPAYSHPEEVGALFSEYTEMLMEGDPSFREYLAVQNYEEEVKHLEVKYGLPEGRLYLAYQGTEPAGCIGLRKIDSKNCEMKRLYVRPAYRGRRIGRLLVERVLEDAKAIGYRHMLLDTLPFLQSAVRMYRQYGFYEIPRYNDNPMDTGIYMKLDLL